MFSQIKNSSQMLKEKVTGKRRPMSTLASPNDKLTTETMRLRITGSQSAPPKDLFISPKLLNIRNKQVFEDCYTLGTRLGSGSFGQVLACQHKDTGQSRAVKILLKKEMTYQEREKLLSETYILNEVSHPNILQLFEYFENFERIMVVTDVYGGGELFEEIVRRQEFSEKDAALVVRQILSATAYCHNLNIVHRDLKPENIMLEAHKQLDEIKLIDFGHATIFEPTEENQFMSKKYGTPYYLAPEVLKQRYTSKCDVWSIGVITYILLSGYPPFSGHSNVEIFDKILKGTFHFGHECWKKVSKDAKDFIEYLLTYEFESRPTAKSALKHKWLKQATLSVSSRKISSLSQSTELKDAFEDMLEEDRKSNENHLPNESREPPENEALLNLRRFNCRYKLKQAVYAYVVSQLLNKEQRESLAQVFRKYDRNGDGLLSKAEVRKAFKKYLGDFYDKDSIDDLFNRIDTDGSGKVDWSEFLMAATSEELVLNHANLSMAFKMFDKDGNNYITVDEMREVLTYKKHVPEHIIEEMIKEADVDQDGKVGRQEFIDMLSY